MKSLESPASVLAACAGTCFALRVLGSAQTRRAAMALAALGLLLLPGTISTRREARETGSVTRTPASLPLRSALAPLEDLAGGVGTRSPR